jgi:hypothetical protein
MVTFSVPVTDGVTKKFFNFKVEPVSVLFAGSRHGSISDKTCSLLVSAFGSLGFSFITGCASGVDSCFRKALIESEYKEKSVVACAFRDRADKLKGLLPLYVVPEGLLPRTALAKRTLWMTSRCSLLVLFPSDPVGKGSLLAFKSAIYNNKPVFIVSNIKPKDSDLYSVYPSSLFGVVQGFWAVPPVYQKTGLCYEAV